MASSTSSSSVPPQSRPIWHPHTVFHITNPARGCTTCKGCAASKRRRCENQIAPHNKKCANMIINRLALRTPSVSGMEDELRQLAECLLCRKYPAYHYQSQVQSVVAEWCEAIRAEERRLREEMLREEPLVALRERFVHIPEEDLARRVDEARVDSIFSSSDAEALLLQSNSNSTLPTASNIPATPSPAPTRPPVVPSIAPQIPTPAPTPPTQPAPCANQHPIRRAIDDDICAICHESLIHNTLPELVWCKQANGCGHSVHLDCFAPWRRQAQESGEVLTCVFCRTPWSDCSQHDLTEPQYSMWGEGGLWDAAFFEPKSHRLDVWNSAFDVDFPALFNPRNHRESFDMWDDDKYNGVSKLFHTVPAKIDFWDTKTCGLRELFRADETRYDSLMGIVDRGEETGLIALFDDGNDDC